MENTFNVDLVNSTISKYLTESEIEFENTDDREAIIVSTKGVNSKLSTLIILTDEVLIFSTPIPVKISQENKSATSIFLGLINKSVLFTKFSFDVDDDLTTLNQLWYEGNNIPKRPFLRVLNSSRSWADMLTPFFAAVAAGILTPDEAINKWQAKQGLPDNESSTKEISA